MYAVTYGGYPVIANWLAYGFGMEWLPLSGEYGVIPLVFTTFYLGIGATALAAVIGIPCAIYLAEFADMRFRSIIKPSLEILTGVPSVVIGLVGFVLIVNVLVNLTGVGSSMLAAWIVVGVMSLPTVASISEDAIRAVPHDLKEASLALGATRWQTMRHILLPAARSGILASLVLAMGAAVGETMAVIMVIGRRVPPPITLNPIVVSNVITAEIVGYWAESASIPELVQALFGLGFILFVIVGVLNLLISRAVKRSVSK
jgi:phosphate transport system permease protein